MAPRTSTAKHSDRTTRHRVPLPRVLESVAPAVAGMGGKTEGIAEGSWATTTRTRTATAREHLLARLVAARSGALVSHDYAAFAAENTHKGSNTNNHLLYHQTSFPSIRAASYHRQLRPRRNKGLLPLRRARRTSVSCSSPHLTPSPPKLNSPSPASRTVRVRWLTSSRRWQMPHTERVTARPPRATTAESTDSQWVLGTACMPKARKQHLRATAKHLARPHIRTRYLPISSLQPVSSLQPRRPSLNRVGPPARSTPLPPGSANFSKSTRTIITVRLATTSGSASSANTKTSSAFLLTL